MTTTVSGRGDRPGAGWAAPGLAFFLIFAVGPMALVGYLSLTRWNGLGQPELIGGANWSRLVRDPGIREAAWLSLVLTVLTWCVQTPVALLLGVWAAGAQRNRAVLSALFFLPLLFSSAAVALIAKALLDPNFGVPAALGELFGFANRGVLGSERGAMLAVVLVAAWQFIPFHTLIYQGGARQIPQQLYQAAVVDGANRRQQFFHITLPQLRNTVVTSSVLMIVGSLTFFDTVLILTSGGPGTSTAIMPYRMYDEAFKRYDMGYASAIACTLVLVATAVSLLLVKLSGFGRMRSTQEGL